MVVEALEGKENADFRDGAVGKVECLSLEVIAQSPESATCPSCVFS